MADELIHPRLRDRAVAVDVASVRLAGWLPGRCCPCGCLPCPADRSTRSSRRWCMRVERDRGRLLLLRYGRLVDTGHARASNCVASGATPASRRQGSLEPLAWREFSYGRIAGVRRCWCIRLRGGRRRRADGRGRLRHISGGARPVATPSLAARLGSSCRWPGDGRIHRRGSLLINVPGGLHPVAPPREWPARPAGRPPHASALGRPLARPSPQGLPHCRTHSLLARRRSTPWLC